MYKVIGIILYIGLFTASSIWAKIDPLIKAELEGACVYTCHRDGAPVTYLGLVTHAANNVLPKDLQEYFTEFLRVILNQDASAAKYEDDKAMLQSIGSYTDVTPFSFKEPKVAPQDALETDLKYALGLIQGILYTAKRLADN